MGSKSSFILFFGSPTKSKDVVIGAASSPISKGDVRIIQRTLQQLSRDPQNPKVVAETEEVLQANAYLEVEEAAALINYLRKVFQNS
jgi:hypothetical protein